MAFILGMINENLINPWPELNETLGLYRVDSEIMQRHIFDFRLQPQAESVAVFRKPEVPDIETGNRKVSHRKLFLE